MACSFITLNWILALECKLIWYVGKESFSVSENIKKCTTISNNLKSQARMTPGGEHGSVWNHDVRGSLFVCVSVAAGCRGFLSPPSRAEEEEAPVQD